MSAVLERCPAELVCFVDADVERSEANIPRTLAESARASGADMTIGQFEWREKKFMMNSTGVYHPLTRALFPEAVDRCGRIVFSGFRILRPEAVVHPIPDGFGAEVHFNVSFAAAGRSIATVELGRYWGPVRDKVDGSHEFAAAVLDHAERLGRLDPARRPEWDAWVEGVAAVIRTWPGIAGGPDADARVARFAERVVELAARPLPPAR